jgi:23S rRNA (cytidine1920-2'-O)/16S rRNA (cytidine1409-2'-O)-methyltransferase
LAISVADEICLDVGSSTGGFTDCLLQAGAKHVIAIDVGYGLLDYSLRKNARVTVLERTNFRHFQASALPLQPSFATVDVSFISLDIVLPSLAALPVQRALVLVKPQFEAHPKDAPGGVVIDPQVRQAVLAHAGEVATQSGFSVAGQTDSRLKGPKGNQESFIYLVRK